MSFTNLTSGLAFVDLGLLVGISIFGAFTAKKLKKGATYLLAYIWLVTLVESISKLYYAGYVQGSNLWLLHVYTLPEFVLLSLMYKNFIPLNKKQKNLFNYYMWGASVLIGLYSVVHLLGAGPSKPEMFQLYSKTLVNSSVICYAGILLVFTLKTPSRFINGFRGMLLINSGMLLYFTGSFVIFLTLRFLVGSELHKTAALWFINALLTLLLHVICAFGLWAHDSRKVMN